MGRVRTGRIAPPGADYYSPYHHLRAKHFFAQGGSKQKRRRVFIDDSEDEVVDVEVAVVAGKEEEKVGEEVAEAVSTK